MNKMMKRQSNIYSRGIMCIPSMMVMTFWFAIWLLWPFSGLVEKKNGNIQKGRLIYTDTGNTYTGVDPMDMIRTPRTATEMDGPSSVLISHYEPSFMPLDREANTNTDLSDEAAQRDLREANRLERTAYVPLWQNIHVLGQNNTKGGSLLIETSGGLRKYGFHLPVDAENLLKNEPLAWQALVFVSTDYNGYVEHVFLEKGADNAAINQAIIRAVEQGRLQKEGRRVEGELTLSFAGKEQGKS